MSSKLFLIKILFFISFYPIYCNAIISQDSKLLHPTVKEKISNVIRSVVVSKTSYKNYKHIGTASWYGNEFKGKRTASGQAFDPEKLTAAHNYLPLNSVVRVTNMSNKKSVDVTITDRGPHKRLGRVIDLSSRAAKQLQFHNEGVTKVSVEYIHNGQKK